MRASSWASTTTRRARSVNRSNMRIAPEAFRGLRPLVLEGRYGRTNPGDSLRVPLSRPRYSAESEQRSRSSSVRLVEGLAHLGRDASPVGDVVAVGAGPVADLLG